MKSRILNIISYILEFVEFYNPISLLFPHPPIRIVYLNFDYEPILPEKQGNGPWAVAFQANGLASSQLALAVTVFRCSSRLTRIV